MVVFIIGVILGFATLSLGGRNLEDKAAEEARRLLAIFELARDESGLTGLQIGWLQTERGYQFVALGEEGWVAYADRGPLRARPLPEPLSLRLKVEDLPVRQDDPKALSPQILFFTSGELTPFELQLRAPQLDSVYRIRGNLLGQLNLERLDRDEVPLS